MVCLNAFHSTFAGCFTKNKHCQNNNKMKKLIEWRHDEVKDVYYEKDLLDIILTMTRKLEDHMTSMSRTHEAAINGNYIVSLFLFLSPLQSMWMKWWHDSRSTLRPRA